MADTGLSAQQAAMISTWDQHTAAEFASHSLEDTLATMTANPYVNHVPVMTGGAGAAAVRDFYANDFLPGLPDDVQTDLIARTVGQNRIVDELAFTCTHSIEMKWLLPGVPPTGKRIESAVVAVVEFEGDRISGERIYWDQASVLAQVGLLDASALPIAGREQMQKCADPFGLPSNTLIERAQST